MKMHGSADVLTTRDTVEGWVFGAVILGVMAMMFAIL
jgi:hypothetical protein